MTEFAGSLRGMQDRFQTGIKQTSSSFALQALRLVFGLRSWDSPLASSSKKFSASPTK
jgi:hypothetical protein